MELAQAQPLASTLELEGPSSGIESRGSRALVAARDDWLGIPPRDIDKPFLLPVEEVFSISGRGTVACGRVERGVINKGDGVEVIGLGASIKTIVTGIEMFRKELDRGEAGDNIGALLRGVKREQVCRGMAIVALGSIKLVRKFQAQIYILTKAEGGRYTPFMSGHRFQLFLRSADTTVSLTFPEDTVDADEKMIMPGDDVDMVCDVVQDVVQDVVAEVGTRFTLREGEKTIGTGNVTKIIE